MATQTRRRHPARWHAASRLLLAFLLYVLTLARAAADAEGQTLPDFASMRVKELKVRVRAPLCRCRRSSSQFSLAGVVSKARCHVRRLRGEERPRCSRGRDIPYASAGGRRQR